MKRCLSKCLIDQSITAKFVTDSSCLTLRRGYVSRPMLDPVSSSNPAEWQWLHKEHSQSTKKQSHASSLIALTSLKADLKVDVFSSAAVENSKIYDLRGCSLIKRAESDIVNEINLFSTLLHPGIAKLMFFTVVETYGKCA